LDGLRPQHLKDLSCASTRCGPSAAHSSHRVHQPLHEWKRGTHRWWQ
jgi:hypothetical protein